LKPGHDRYVAKTPLKTIKFIDIKYLKIFQQIAAKQKYSQVIDLKNYKFSCADPKIASFRRVVANKHLFLDHKRAKVP